MSNACETVQIPMEADALWRRIGGFVAVGHWHPMLASVESEGDREGATRTARAQDGSTQVERLQHIDERRHVYRYVMESTALPVRDYVGEFRIDDNGDGTSTVVWSAQFEPVKADPDDVIGMIGAFLKAGTDNLSVLYGSASPRSQHHDDRADRDDAGSSRE